MAADDVLVTSVDTAGDLFIKLGTIGRWLQALGILVIFWIIMQLINWILNRKRIKRLDAMSNRLENIEKKIDKLASDAKTR